MALVCLVILREIDDGFLTDSEGNGGIIGGGRE